MRSSISPDKMMRAAPDAAGPLPFAPLFSSEGKGWRGFAVRRYRLPAFEVPEYEASQHHIVIELGSPVRIEMQQNGRERHGRLLKGEVTYTPAGASCGSRWEDDREILKISFDPEFFARAARATLHRRSVATAPQFRLRDPLIEGVGLALAAEVESGAGDDPGYAESLATVLAAHLLKTYSAALSPPDIMIGELPPHKLRRATDFIDMHLEDDVALVDIAAEVKMSPYHFSRMFKRTTGSTPQQYVLTRKVERAKQLLTQTPAPLADIAHALGFSSQSHFTAHFHRLTGVTPKAYRLAHEAPSSGEVVSELRVS